MTIRPLIPAAIACALLFPSGLSAQDGIGYELPELLPRSNVVSPQVSDMMKYDTRGTNISRGSVDFGGGRLMPDSTGRFRPLYHVTDRLGSVRVICDGAGNVLERNDYYPSGLRWDTSTPQLDANRLKFNGKEDQTLILNTGSNGASSATSSILHYGARLCSPALCRWLSPDPLAEKYYSTTPYAFCANNPVNVIDPDGLDIWEIDTRGNVHWIEESETHQLYALDKDGKRTGKYVTVKDRTILDDLTGTHDNGFSYSKMQDSNTDDVFRTFLFAADNTDVEWAVHKNGSTYTIGTKHDEGSAGNWEDYDIEKPDVSLHSHTRSGTETVQKEIESMGYWGSPYGDWYNVRSDVHRNGQQTRLSYVYMQSSTRLYYVGYYRALYIRHINGDHKRFYFGVLNNK